MCCMCLDCILLPCLSLQSIISYSSPHFTWVPGVYVFCYFSFLKPYHIPYTFASEGNPVHPLEPCSAPGHTIPPGGRNAPLQTNIYNKRGVNMFIQGCIETPWKYGMPQGRARFQGVHWVSLRSESISLNMLRFQEREDAKHLVFRSFVK